MRAAAPAEHRRRRGDADVWPAKAVVRAGLLLDVGPVAAQLRYLLGHGGLRFTYTMNAARLNQWTSLHAKANRIVAERARGGQPRQSVARAAADRAYEFQALVPGVFRPLPGYPLSNTGRPLI
jgi:hypothetical protein